MPVQDKLFYEKLLTTPESERLLGPIIGTFVVNRVTSLGEQPEEIKRAWIGVPLPLRGGYDRIEGEVEIYTRDGLNALAANGAPDSSLSYWMHDKGLLKAPGATLVFNADDGEVTLGQHPTEQLVAELHPRLERVPHFSRR